MLSVPSLFLEKLLKIKIKIMNKIYMIWYRNAKGELQPKVIVRADSAKLALERLLAEYPDANVSSLSEEKMEII